MVVKPLLRCAFPHTYMETDRGNEELIKFAKDLQKRVAGFYVKVMEKRGFAVNVWEWGGFREKFLVLMEFKAGE